MRNSRCILALFILSLVMTIPLFHGKVIQGHDTQYAFIKTVSMYQSWTYGDLVGRWTPDIIHGYGYPNFNYYAPLFFWITAGLSMVVHNLIWGFNLGLFLTFFASACAMYFYAKEFWGIEGGFLSAVAYLFAPYHLVELYVRGACGELTAFVFIPLTLFAFHRLKITPKTIYFLTATVSLACLILSHNLTAMFCFPILFIYAAIIVAQKKFNTQWACAYLIIFALSIALSAFFWMPAILEQKYVQINRILQGYDYRQHFIFWDQLFYSPWGNGGSGPKRTDDGMSFQIGPMHLLILVIVLFRFKKLNFIKSNSLIFVIYWCIVALLSALLTLQISAIVWQMIPILHLASLPWRFLLVVTFAVSFLIGGLCKVFKKSQTAVSLGAALLIIAANIFYCHDFGYQNITIKTAKEYLQSSTPLDEMEYLPQNVKILRLMPTENKLEVVQGKGDILDHKSSSGLQHSYTILASTPVILLFHSFYFPGWEVMIDRRNTPILTDNPFGLIAFTASEGKHFIEIKFQDTLIHILCQWFSLANLLIVTLIFFFRKKIDQILFKSFPHFL